MIISNNRIFENIQKLDIFKDTEEQSIEYAPDDFRDFPIRVSFNFKTSVSDFEILKLKLDEFDELVEDVIEHQVEEVYPEKQFDVFITDNRAETQSDTFGINKYSKLHVHYMILDRETMVTVKLLIRPDCKYLIDIFRLIVVIINGLYNIVNIFSGSKINYIEFSHIKYLDNKEDRFKSPVYTVRLNDLLIDSVVHTENLNHEFLVNQLVINLYNLSVMIMEDKQQKPGTIDNETLDKFMEFVKKYKR